MNIICFHNPDEKNGYLSNWFYSEFSVDDVKFNSIEQFMMYKKAMCFSDSIIAKQILDAKDTAEMKTLGRCVSEYNDNIWNGIRQIIVYEGLLAKFSQNIELKEQLKNTKNAILAECAVKDRIWGIGLSMNDPRRLEINQWLGMNLLGYTLMMVRNRV
ncbi:MAG: NADAR family protein [Lachnospiraceae bacterium]|nr:NADAR family protein [Lachnospiraceae bacterium]